MDVTPLLDFKALSQRPVDGGGSCDIYRGRLYDGPMVALKVMRVVQIPTKETEPYPQENMQRMMGIWKDCNHPNVAHLIGGAMVRGGIAAVYGWLDYGSVIEYLKRHPTTDRYQFSTQICEGVAYLHANGIIHNSLKGSNILVSGNGVPCIHISLLTSTNLADDEMENKVPSLNIRWAAPELLLAESGGTFASDVYALGMLGTVSGAYYVPPGPLTRQTAQVQFMFVTL
ncbi:unnamed protein product [Rhizoctonia solani]|uniref:Protein kinase domain-containing protein n=1 Tax=Rhizoctonia solani TaxID=456999 RepID=A0A8H3BFW0_9AGAM|nr:unnamed protein product [Rhizoctonia solani]